jgi:thiol-disulfide isomerase/thioredoxin
MSTLSQSNDADGPGTDMDPGSKPAGNQRSLKIVWIISLAVLFVLVFCGGFVFFYLRNQQKPASQSATKTPHPLPEAKLIDESNQQLPDSELKHGRLILVFITSECDACMKESQFLRTVVGKYNKIPFYGVVSFGEKDVALREAKDKFPFKVFYDEHLQLAGPLGITRVPVKLFVEDGVIKKAWGGATVDDQAKADFIKWLDDLP